ncbi:MAG: citrate lyase holo-[acyl-carrier protein] synthase [Deltaproteobacteria bacterium]|jgi:holo-ACP synthase|nr:citrate lyase holo-[acyl-carrier protein] synthase [Deltaproteobacteria bacterium]
MSRAGRDVAADEGTIQGLLAARESRFLRQLDAISRFKGPMVAISVNVPGPDKLSGPWEGVLAAGLGALEGEIARLGLPVSHRHVGSSLAGHEAWLIVQADPARLKRLAMGIESDHPLGRLMDIDVLGPGGEPLGREAVGAPKRPCLVCGEEVARCRLSGRHDAGEVLGIMTKMAEGYLLAPGRAGPKATRGD